MVGQHGPSQGTVSARRPRLLGDVEVQLLPALSASCGDTGTVGSSHRVSQREPHLHGGVQGSASVHSATIIWKDITQRKLQIEHRPWVQLVPRPTKNLIYAINEYKRKHYQLRCVVYDIQRAHYGGDYGPIGHASWEKRFMIWGWQDKFDRVPDLVQWSQDYSSILCLPISDPVPKPRVMLKALYRRDVDIIRRFMPLSLFPGNAIWHPDDIEQMTAVKHESDAEGEDADMIRSLYWSTPPTRSLAPSSIKLAVSKLDPSSRIRHGTKISAQISVLPPAAETQLELQNQSLCSPLSRD